MAQLVLVRRLHSCTRSIRQKWLNLLGRRQKGEVRRCEQIIVSLELGRKLRLIDKHDADEPPRTTQSWHALWMHRDLLRIPSWKRSVLVYPLSSLAHQNTDDTPMHSAHVGVLSCDFRQWRCPSQEMELLLIEAGDAFIFKPGDATTSHRWTLQKTCSFTSWRTDPMSDTLPSSRQQ